MRNRSEMQAVLVLLLVLAKVGDGHLGPLGDDGVHAKVDEHHVVVVEEGLVRVVGDAGCDERMVVVVEQLRDGVELLDLQRGVQQVGSVDAAVAEAEPLPVDGVDRARLGGVRVVGGLWTRDEEVGDLVVAVAEGRVLGGDEVLELALEPIEARV